MPGKRGNRKLDVLGRDLSGYPTNQELTSQMPMTVEQCAQKTRHVSLSQSARPVAGENYNPSLGRFLDF